eukprot:COSAG05_NODE_159_length_15652_cov_14.134636_4_plen_344_part_00
MSPASDALARARELLLHARFGEAAAASFAAFGVSCDPTEWTAAAADLPLGGGAKGPKKQQVAQLSCIAIQCAIRQGKPEVADIIVASLYGGMTEASAAASVPVEVALSLAHALVRAGQHAEAEAALRARIASLQGSGVGASPTRAAARADGAILVEYLLFCVLCAGHKGADGVAGAKAYLGSVDCPKLPRTVREGFMERLEQIEAAEAKAAAEANAAARKRREDMATGVTPSMTADPVSTKRNTSASESGRGRARGQDISSQSEQQQKERGQQRALGRQIVEFERSRPSALVLFWWWLRSKRGLTTVGVLAVLAFVLRPQGRLGRWLKEQIEAMAEVALSVRY